MLLVNYDLPHLHTSHLDQMTEVKEGGDEALGTLTLTLEEVMTDGVFKCERV